VAGRDGRVADDGAASDDGLVVGTYLHGLLENGAFRRALLERLAARREHQQWQLPRPRLGAQLLNRVAEDVKATGKVESMPRLEGRQMVMMIGPTR